MRYAAMAFGTLAYTLGCSSAAMALVNLEDKMNAAKTACAAVNHSNCNYDMAFKYWITANATCTVANHGSKCDDDMTLSWIKVHSKPSSDTALTLRDKRSPATRLPAGSPQGPSFQIPPLFAIAGTGCEPVAKGLFLRSSTLDNFIYEIAPASPGAADAKGASISYTDNQAAGTKTAVIDGRLSYLLFGEQCGGYPTDTRYPFVSAVALAPFVASQGTWSEPTPKKVSNSAIQAGVDFQLGVSAGATNFGIEDSYFYVSPYYQTDFQQKARLDGLVLAWEPVVSSLSLGTQHITSPWLNFFWQLRPEADFVRVSDPGLTKFSRGDLALLGATARANLALFPLNSQIPWNDWIGGRISFIGTASDFWDSQTGANLSYYTATAQYKLGPCKADTTGKDPTGPCSIQGSSSISVEYDWGTAKETLVHVKQWLCAPKARIISGGRFHPESCRLIR
jgi:hypothetical protein